MTLPDAFLLPNLITFGRILTIPLFLYLILSAQPVLSAVVFSLIALSDAVDGFIARRFNQTSDLGKFLDPAADKVLVVSALLALIELGRVPSLPVILIIARDLLVSVYRMQAAKSGEVISAGVYGKSKTVVQMLAILMLILGAPFGLEVLWLAVILTVFSGVEYIVRKK